VSEHDDADRAPGAFTALVGLTAASRGRRRLALVTAVAAVVVEALSFAEKLPYVYIGGVAVAWTLVPALALAVACGTAIAGRQRSRPAALTFGCMVGLALISTSTLLISRGHSAMLAGLIVAIAVEELVYRLAVPALVAGLLHRFGVRSNVARIIGFVVGGAWFVVLPGHRAQWANAAAVAGFVAFATIAALVVYRSGSVLAAFLAHLCADLLTTLYWFGLISLHQRGLVLASVLILLVLAYGPPAARRQRPRRPRLQPVAS
jgi:hypothetical protein